MLALTLRALVLPNKAKRLIPLFVLWIGFYGITPVLRIALASDVCFNQATGEPLKWFVAAPDGTLTFYDSPGFDTSGVEKKPVTPQVCRIADLERRGIRPTKIADLSEAKFFDGVSGRPLVWYTIDTAGLIHLFNAEGFDPDSGALLQPVTEDIVVRARQQATEAAAEQQRIAAEAEAKRQRAAAAEAAQREVAELIVTFNPDSYGEGIVVVGFVADQDAQSIQFAEFATNELERSLRGFGWASDRLRPAVYQSGHFERLFAGDRDAMTTAGLTAKTRSALFLSIAARCEQASSVSGLRSCTGTVQARVFPAGAEASVLREATVTAAGANERQALERAAALLRERHTEILEGL
jgi:hypothetical protein